MAARRPKTPKTELPNAEKIADIMNAAPLIAEAKEAVAKPTIYGIAYASIRVHESPGKLRNSVSVKLIEAGRDQTITLYAGKAAPDGSFVPFVHFCIMPSGVEVPVENVSGAVPVQSQLAEKMSRVERLAKRRAALVEKMGERALEKAEARADEPPTDPNPRKGATKGRPKIQEIPVDEDDLDDSLDDDSTEPTESGDE